MLTEGQRTLVLDLAQGTLSHADFFSAFDVDRPRSPQWTVDLLQEACSERQPDDVECGLILASVFGYLGDPVPVLCRLLLEGWHHKHEDIASALDGLKDARTVDALYKGAFLQPEYLAHDEGNALARKCTWGLAKIGMPEAIANLRDLSRKGRPQVQEYARKLL
jgi:hypothetical protein